MFFRLKSKLYGVFTYWRQFITKREGLIAHLKLKWVGLGDINQICVSCFTIFLNPLKVIFFFFCQQCQQLQICFQWLNQYIKKIWYIFVKFIFLVGLLCASYLNRASVFLCAPKDGSYSYPCEKTIVETKRIWEIYHTIDGIPGTRSQNFSDVAVYYSTTGRTKGWIHEMWLEFMDVFLPRGNAKTVLVCSKTNLGLKIDQIQNMWDVEHRVEFMDAVDFIFKSKSYPYDTDVLTVVLMPSSLETTEGLEFLAKLIFMLVPEDGILVGSPASDEGMYVLELAFRYLGNEF